MNQKSSSLWLIALVALAGVFRLSPPATSSPVRGASEEGAKLQENSSSESSTAEEVDKLLIEHYSIRRDTACPSSAEPAVSTQIKKVDRVLETSPDLRTVKEGAPVVRGLPECLRVAAEQRFLGENGRVIIALVPDPIDTRISYRFDESLEAIQTGAQDAQYVLDRFSLPWPKSQKAGANPDEAFRSQPGVLFFRRNPGGATDPLIVLLVGETPTAGIHPSAFVAALKEARYLLPMSQDVRIVGPNFSGSVKSLKTALNEWFKEEFANPLPTIRFFGANTTSLEARNYLRNPSLPTVEFYGTVLPDEVTKKGIEAYLKRLGVNPRRTAVLVEADSGYGSSLLNESDTDTSSWKVRYRLPYPMQVSQVRTRYQKEVAVSSTPVSLGEDPVRASLHLSVDERGGDRDKPEAYAPGPTANIAELSLTAIIDTLHRERINYVGLYGTDTRDKLFLARLIRSRFKDIRFFTDDSDILYTHPDYASDLWGMLVFSTYPLVSHEFTWVRDGKDVPDADRLRQFSSQMAQSIHNATRLALDAAAPENEPDYFMTKNPGFGGKALLPGYGAPLRVPAISDLPHLWVTAVGNNALWPLYETDPWNRPKTFSRDETIRTNIGHSRAFLSLIVLLNVYCLMECLFFNGEFLAPFKDHGLLARFRKNFSTIFRPIRKDVNNQEFVRVSRGAIAGYFSVLLLGSVVTTGIAFLLPGPTLHYGLPGRALEVWAVFTAVLMLDCALHAGIRVFSEAMLSDEVRLLVFIGEVLLLGGGYLAFSAWWIPGPLSIMFYERATRLSSGVSPLLPTLFLGMGVTVWLICFLKRTQITVAMAKVQPYPASAKSASAKGFFHMQKMLKKAMTETYRLNTWGMGTIATALASGALLFAAYKADFFGTIEPVPVQHLLWVLFSVLVVGLLRTVRDFVFIAYQLQRFLRRLAFHRLTPAFERLSPKCARGLSTDLFSSPPALTELQEPFDRLVDIRNEFATFNANQNGLSAAQQAALPGGLDAAVKSVGVALSSDLSKAGRSDTKKWALPSETQQELCKQARILFGNLCMYWDTEVFDGLNSKSRKALAHRFRLCEDFVASQIVSHLDAVFVCLRYLIVCAGLVLLCVFLAVSCYPYSSQNLMMNSTWVLVVVCSLTFFGAFMRFSRTEVLRAIRTKDGTLQSSYRAAITQLVLFVLLPALGFLTSQFPTLGRLVLSWIGPAMKSINL